MTKQEAYKKVFDDLKKSSPKMFFGTYDGEHGNTSFMYGICTVMEYLAYQADPKTEQVYDEFSTEFVKNMTKSEKRA